MNREECPEWCRLVEEYSRLVTEFSFRREAARRAPPDRQEEDWRAAEAMRAASQVAWEVLERHMAGHGCLDLNWPGPDSSAAHASDRILQKAAEAALDIILVADDDRRLVDVNDAAANMLRLPKTKIVGQRIDEFFSEAGGKVIPEAWKSFVAEGVQCGICVLNDPAPRRTFEYRAKAHFAPGLHLAVLREVRETA